jgi:hypothetical protein
MPRRTEAIAFTDDQKIANVVGETLISSLAANQIEVVLDTLIDHDRGYFPRHGIIDRRYNPRLAYHVFRHLHRAVSGRRDELRISKLKTSSGIKAFDIQTTEFRCTLVLPDIEQNTIVLEYDSDVDTQNGSMRIMDLHTGRMKEIQVKILKRNRLALQNQSILNEPFLLVMG